MLEVYLQAHNEEKRIAWTIDFYRQRFPGCEVTVYDNESTDRTKDVCKERGCRIIDYPTKGQYDEIRQAKWRDMVWLEPGPEWVIVADADECLDVNPTILSQSLACGAYVIRSIGYHMVSDYDGQPMEEVRSGVRTLDYAKPMCFYRPAMLSANFSFGGHYAEFKPAKGYSVDNLLYKSYCVPMYHYRYLDLQETIERNARSIGRFSARSKEQGFGPSLLNAEKTTKEFEELRQKKERILPGCTGKMTKWYLCAGKWGYNENI